MSAHPPPARVGAGATANGGSAGGTAASTRLGRARYRRILRFAARQLAQEWWFELFLPRIGLRRITVRGRTRRQQLIARRFHRLALDLGGLMIKVGQFMSSRLDVLPPEITDELEGLQDEVPPVDFASIRALAEAELGVPLESAYESFDPVPLAAASLGQAHRARLSPADAAEAGFADVVVKVQRPGIDEIVAIDLAALRRVAGWLSRVRLIADRTDAPALVEEFAVTSLEEVDYLHEGASAERFAAHFAADPRARAPRVAWERSTRKLLTLSDVSAIKINDTDALRAAGIDPAAVANTLAGVMFDQLLVDGFFHADPHPGNIFVTPGAGVAEGDPARDWALTFVDFGMMGQVPAGLRAGLQQLILAAVSRDAKGLVAGMRSIGTLLPSADTDELERALTALFDRFGGMGFAELREVDPREFADFADRFGDVVRTMPFQLPENFLLVIRAVSVTSGVCSSLDPSFNIWNAVEPYANQLLQRGGLDAVRAAGRSAASAVGVAARLPGRIDELVTRLDRGQLAVAAPGAERELRTLQRLVRRLLFAVVFAALLVAGAVLLRSSAVWGLVLMTASVLPLGFALFGGMRPGHPRGPRRR